MNYYDAVLMVIPTLFLLGGSIAYVTSIPFKLSVIVGAAMCIVIVGHSLFINPPADPEQLPGVDSSEVENSSFNLDSITSDD